MLNKKEKQYYTKEDIKFFDTLSIFKKNYHSSEINIIQNNSKIEEKYTINDHNNFKHIINDQDNDVDHVTKNNTQNKKALDYSKNDLKNFEKFDTQVYSYNIEDNNFENKLKFTKKTQTNYKKNDLENFNQIIKNEENNEKNSVKNVNVYEHKNYKSKKKNINIKKIKILYFD